MRQEILLTTSVPLFRKFKEWDGMFASGRTLKAGTVVTIGELSTLRLKECLKPCYPLILPQGACSTLGLCGEDYYLLAMHLPAGSVA